MSADIFVARQPIFDAKREVFAYELLFRSSMENFFQGATQDEASSRVIESSLHDFGLSELTSGLPAFINTTKEILVNDFLMLLPRAQTVIEILEDVDPDDEVLAACRRLKDKGYLIALDDFQYHPKLEPLVEVADIVKVDFTLTKAGAPRRKLADTLNRPHLKLLAEKVETPDDFLEGRDLGFTYFQGYFFCKPEVVSRKGIPSNKLNNLRFMQAINAPDFDVNGLEDLIKKDVSLSYKLLKYLNSACFRWRKEVTSIRRAITLMGQRPMMKWATLVGLTALSDDKPKELVMTALVRARFGELIGMETGDSDRAFDLFLIGMFSLIDALTNRDLETVLKELQLREAISNTLLQRTNGDLQSSLDLILAQEKGDWDSVSRSSRDLKLDESAIPQLYGEALAWAHGISSG